MTKEEKILKEILQEYKQATKKFGKFNSTHEGHSVIEEEFDELWDEIKANTNPMGNMRKEAIQLTAMGLRFIVDCCSYESSQY